MNSNTNLFLVNPAYSAADSSPKKVSENRLWGIFSVDDCNPIYIHRMVLSRKRSDAALLYLYKMMSK
jgi:hypothetical protein